MAPPSAGPRPRPRLPHAAAGRGHAGPPSAICRTRRTYL